MNAFSMLVADNDNRPNTLRWEKGDDGDFLVANDGLYAVSVDSVYGYYALSHNGEAIGESHSLNRIKEMAQKNHEFWISGERAALSTPAW